MSELEAYTQAVADLEERGVFRFSEDSAFRTNLPSACTVDEVSSWSIDMLEEYLVARSVLDNLRFIETVVSSVA